jgi:hypothetical protein
MTAIAHAKTLDELIGILGPADQDVGSGLYILLWKRTGPDGVEEIRASSPGMALPLSRLWRIRAGVVTELR